MKRIIFLLSLLLAFSANAQDVVMEKVQEVQMNKDALFTKAKMFITDKWVNPKWSIQNEDKESGVIQVKTTKEIVFKQMLVGAVYNYEYLTRFRFKDNKYKIEIYDVTCTNAQQVGAGTECNVPLIPYFEGENAPEKTKSLGKGISKKDAIKMMNALRSEFSSIIDGYFKFLKTDNDDF